MGYATESFTIPGEISLDYLAARDLRSGAAYESGAPLPTGIASAFPLAPLPPLLLAPKPKQRQKVIALLYIYTNIYFCFYLYMKIYIYISIYLSIYL